MLQGNGSQEPWLSKIFECGYIVKEFGVKIMLFKNLIKKNNKSSRLYFRQKMGK